MSCAILLEFHLLLRDPVSRLQDTTAQIRDIAYYVCNAAAGLVGDEASLNALAHKTLHDLELTLSGDDAWAASFDHPGSEEGHCSVQMCKPDGIQDGNTLTVPMSSG